MIEWTLPILTFLLQGSAASPPMPPAPIVTVPLEQRLVAWVPGEVRCDGMLIDGAGVRRPSPDLRALPSGSQLAATFTFAIDADGRTHSIARSGAMMFGIGADLAPSLAASRFPPVARRDCTLTYAARSLPIAEAAIADLVEYSVRPSSGRPPKAVWDRIGAGGDCMKPPNLQPLVRVSPDYRKLAGTAGQAEWAVIAYDITASGEPANVRVAHSTRHAPLDRAAAEALGKSRFAEGARQGCLLPFVRGAETLPAPKSPPEHLPQPPGGACASDDHWAVAPRLTYPQAYRRRGIEGWAHVTYDVAPWGQIANVTVVESQPSEDFGTQAQAMLRAARTKPLPQGATGCSELVRFVMADDEPPAPAEPPAPF